MIQLLSKEELMTYMGNAPVKDLRTISSLLIDMLSDKQVQVLNEFFTKKISFSGGLVQKKKVPQIRVKEPIVEAQETGIEPEDEIEREVLKTQREQLPEKDELTEEELYDEGVNENLVDYEIDTDLLQQEQQQETTPEQEHKRPLTKEEFEEMEKEFEERKRKAQS